MASLRGSTVLFDGDLAANAKSAWAYVGSATDVTLFIDDGGGSANWLIQVAVDDGQAGLNGIDPADPDAVAFSDLLSRIGTARVVATAGTPVAVNLSPFAAQYIRVVPDGNVTAGSARVNCVARNSRSLRGHQVLWDAVDLSTNDVSAAGFIGTETNAVLFLHTSDAADAYAIWVAAGSGSAGMNTPPAESDWALLYAEVGDQILFHTTSGVNAAIDLSPFGGSWVRLKAAQDSTGVTATLAVTD